MSTNNNKGVRLNPTATISILCLSALLLLPTLAGIFTDHKARSSWEKRSLATWPSLFEQGVEDSYFSALEAFINDHIGFALELNRFYRKLKFYVYRDNPVANIIVGSDDFVFLSSYSSKDPHAILQALCQEKAHLARQPSIKNGIDTLTWSAIALDLKPSFAIFPSKPVLYPDALPAGIPTALREACAGFARRNNFPSQLAKSRPQHVYYPLPQFQVIKMQPHFYPPGNFHAKGKSAHEFARGFLTMLEIPIGENYDLGATLVDARSDLQSMMGFIYTRRVWHYPYETFDITRLRRQPKLVMQHYPSAKDFAHLRTKNPASERVALLLSNSFGAFTAPHLAPGFREIFQININHLDPLQTRPLIKAMLENYAITDVIYLVHDAALINGHKLGQLSEALREHAIEVWNQ